MPGLLPIRWADLIAINHANDAAREIGALVDSAQDQALRVEALYCRAWILIARHDRVHSGPAVDEFLKLAPKDDRAPGLLAILARDQTDPAKRAPIIERLGKDYPDSSTLETITPSSRRSEAIGKPFDLRFVDAISGADVSIAGLKGKVVVIDFWATWCPACVREIPRMKAIYASYRDQGVAFIGVSLDRSEASGGLAKLRNFVAEHDVPWPQYYQGSEGSGKFAGEWGVSSIPCVFLVDQDGNLASTHAREDLEILLPRLLSRRPVEGVVR